MDREIQDSIQSSRQLIHTPPPGSAGTLRPTISRRIKMPAVGRGVSPSREGEWRMDRVNQDSIQPSLQLIHIPPPGSAGTLRPSMRGLVNPEYFVY